MRLLPAILTAAITVFLIWALNGKALLPAPLGALMAPQSGFWQNAEKLTENFSGEIKLPGLKDKVEVYFDDRAVPHVFAQNDGDAWMVQGYLHAKFRLWQMQLQAMAAGGRASEIIGEAALQHDRSFRRLGMVYGAEKALEEIEKNPETKLAFDSYTAGINAYINQLNPATLPLEYKLTATKPEPWTNLHSALFLKYMSYDLASWESDFEMTKAKNYFSAEDFNLLFPEIQDSLDPIIQKGTPQIPPSIHPVQPVNADTSFIAVNDIIETEKPDRANGSNNWAIGPSRSKSGYAILCNDPHLGLNIPSLWYEIQLSTPQYNAYGASFPGAPGVIIGFNDSIAFGFTNGGRDVRDYYQVKFKDRSKKEYWFNNEWRKTELKIEEIKIAGKPTFYDTVAYTVFGPVMYDDSFNGNRTDSVNAYAVRWTAHFPSNEPLIFLHLNKAVNYAQYVEAAKNLQTPGQNVVFAAKNSDIAIRTQGNWPAKWKGQGDVVMPGTDSSYLWQGMIPQNEVPYMYNPERGFVSSANQRPVDYSYSYYLGKNYPVDRGKTLNRLLNRNQQFTVQDMMDMHINNYDFNAELIIPVIKKYMPANSLNTAERNYFNQMVEWDYFANATSVGATVFSVFWQNFYDTVYFDEYSKAPKNMARPIEETLPDAIKRDTAYKFIDDISTPQKETLADMLLKAMQKTATDLSASKNGLEWGKYKQTRLYHLTKIPFLSSPILNVGGSGASLNANKMNTTTRQAHGPSWRMIVHMAPQTEAYGIYPGGQSGNPGSRFYLNSVNEWASGKYYSLWMMKPDEGSDKRVLGKLTISN